MRVHQHDDSARNVYVVRFNFALHQSTPESVAITSRTAWRGNERPAGRSHANRHTQFMEKDKNRFCPRTFNVFVLGCGERKLSTHIKYAALCTGGSMQRIPNRSARALALRLMPPHTLHSGNKSNDHAPRD